MIADKAFEKIYSIVRIFRLFKVFSSKFAIFHFEKPFQVLKDKIPHKKAIFDISNFPTFPENFPNIFIRKTILCT